MVTKKRKQIKKYRFELTRGAIGGIGIVCFCIFLWMFLLGVWTGQSLLMPSFYDNAVHGDSPHQIVDLDNQKKHRPK